MADLRQRLDKQEARHDAEMARRLAERDTLHLGHIERLLAQEIAAVFLADAPARLERMRALAASRAAEQLGQEAHALAGSAGTLGLRALAAAARSLEAASVSASTDELPARLAPLEALTAAAVAWLTPKAADAPIPCGHQDSAR